MTLEREFLLPEAAARPDVIGLDRFRALQEQVVDRANGHQRDEQERHGDQRADGEQHNARAHARCPARHDEEHDGDRGGDREMRPGAARKAQQQTAEQK